MNLQVWISAYARMRSRLVVVPLAPPYIPHPDNALQGLRFTRFNFTRLRACLKRS
ncbi:hypothetical protein Hc94105_1743 [Helicobacter cinaedi]|uniref:hypothetical protein n=1 Tax=Helicobacter cinaedi TaxID=213 RepID=UPI001F406F6A|nr:hypothetical protein [Helicobacter cinaedi]BDB67520.1 hypothetical protein Hc94105_1743 [Helicobacter cinaedi]